MLAWVMQINSREWIMLELVRVCISCMFPVGIRVVFVSKTIEEICSRE